MTVSCGRERSRRFGRRHRPCEAPKDVPPPDRSDVLLPLPGARPSLFRAGALYPSSQTSAPLLAHTNYPEITSKLKNQKRYCSRVLFRISTVCKHPLVIRNQSPLNEGIPPYLSNNDWPSSNPGIVRLQLTLSYIIPNQFTSGSRLFQQRQPLGRIASGNHSECSAVPYKCQNF